MAKTQRGRGKATDEGKVLQKDFNIICMARGGVGTINLMSAIVEKALEIDDGTLLDRAGHPGFAWSKGIQTKHHRRGVAVASLARILLTGAGNYRSLSAFSQAMYHVTMNQSDHITRRIEELWDSDDKVRYIPIQIQDLPQAVGQSHPHPQYSHRKSRRWWRRGGRELDNI